MKPWLEKVDPTVIKKDAKSQLQEMLQQQGRELPVYKMLEESEINQTTQFKVSCAVMSLGITIESMGSSIKKAEQSAADKMIELLVQQ